MGRKSSHISLSRMYDISTGHGRPVSPALEHINNCRQCRGNRDWLVALLQFGGREPSNEPPSWSVANTIRAFRLKKPSAVRFAKETLATLVYDSFNEPLPIGMRQRDLPARQTLYSGGGLQLDLKVQVTQQEKGIIIGQIVCEDANFGVHDLEIALSQDGDLIGVSSTNPLGEFMFEDLPRGEYELQVQFGEKVLRLPKVPLGSS